MGVFQIAIDGPVAAGKGTVSRKLSEKLGFLYVDTGATYRVATLIAKRHNFDFDGLDKQVKPEVLALVKLVENARIEMRTPGIGEQDGRLITIVLNGEDVSWAIRDESISERVAVVAKIAQVREVLVAKQQEIASVNDVVMEGRDITYRVLPEALLKIYLDASEEVRVERRFEQLSSQGRTVDKEHLRNEIRKRDELDMNRETDPLKIIDGAWHFDASGLSIDETVNKIVEKVEKLRVQKE